MRTISQVNKEELPEKIIVINYKNPPSVGEKIVVINNGIEIGYAKVVEVEQGRYTAQTIIPERWHNKKRNKRIVHHWRNNVPVKDISKMYGLSKDRIYKIIERYELELQK